MLTAKQERFRKMTPEELVAYRKALATVYEPTGRIVKIS